MTIQLYITSVVSIRGAKAVIKNDGLPMRFRKQADALQHTHPKVAKVLNKLVETYEYEAEWRDAEDAAEKRLWNW